MSLFNPYWGGTAAELANNPDVRVRTLTVVGDNPMTLEQSGLVDAAYASFKQVAQHSLPGLQHQHLVLTDGTEIEILSIGGRDEVIVKPPPPGKLLNLTSLFFAVPSDRGDLNVDMDPKFSGMWPFRSAGTDPDELPAARKLTEEETIFQHPGNLTWWSANLTFNDKPIIVSWWGRATRYGHMDYYGRHSQIGAAGFQFETMYSPAGTGATPTVHRTNWADAFKSAVWVNGVKHDVVDGSDAPVPVMSAALKVVDGALVLHIVTHDSGALKVFTGTLQDIYKPGDVVVSELFAIDFTIDSTPLSAPNPLWETLLQPLYFNASCTQIAGLVVCKGSSAVNITAKAAIPAPINGTSSYVVLLCEVDIVAETTAFTAGGSDVRSKDRDYNIAGTIAAGFSATEDETHDETITLTSYGAVDFVGDVLTVIMTEFTREASQVRTGTWEWVGDESSQEVDWEVTYRSYFRVFRLADDETLYERDSGWVDVGTFHAELFGEPSGGGGRVGEGTGNWAETISADITTMASVEGGDIRAGLLVIYEFCERGNSTYAATFTNPSTGPTSLDPAIRTGFLGVSWDLLRGLSVSDGGERENNLCRSIVEKDGVELAVTDTPVTVGSQTYSAFGPRSFMNQYLQVGSSTELFFEWNQIDLLFTSTTGAACDVLASVPASPYSISGRPFVNTFAASPDKVFMFYNVGPNHQTALGLTDGLSTGAFLIAGNSFTLDGSKYHPETSSEAVLSTPVFIDNVPRQE
jgi:hypothetical protein